MVVNESLLVSVGLAVGVVEGLVMTLDTPVSLAVSEGLAEVIGDELTVSVGVEETLTGVLDAGAGIHSPSKSIPNKQEVVAVCVSEELAEVTGVELTVDRKSTRLNSSHSGESRMPSSA